MWLMDRLHAHHHTDDDGLWPLIRRGNPAAAGLLEAMQAEHRAIMPAIEAVIAAAQNYRSEPDDAARLDLIQALDALTGVLLPHLDRELAGAMPRIQPTTPPTAASTIPAPPGHPRPSRPQGRRPRACLES
jgi:Hemerythrin HHE cation binding domain